MSLNELAQITNRSRQHVTRRVASLEHTDGKRGAKLYESEEAIPLILAVSELEQLRAEATRERMLLAQARQEVREGKRIPIELIMDWTDHALKTMRARILASLGKELTDERREWILEEWPKLIEKVKSYPTELRKKRARGLT